MKSKLPRKAAKAAKRLRKTYRNKQMGNLLELIFGAALASDDAGSWPSHLRGEAIILHNRIKEVCS